MQAVGPIYGLCILIHLALFVSSLQPDKTKKLLQAIAVLLLVLPLHALAQGLETSGVSSYRDIAGWVDKTRYLLPFLSFAVYAGRGRKVRKTSR